MTRAVMVCGTTSGDAYEIRHGRTQPSAGDPGRHVLRALFGRQLLPLIR